MNYIPVLSIAGSDPSGGAGIQADIKTVSALGCYAMTAVTAVTAQNTTGVRDVMVVPPAMVAAQINAVCDDIQPLAVKTGMLATPETIAAVADALRRRDIRHLVADPVMCATSGDSLAAAGSREAYMHCLLPLAEVATPNLPEAEWLAGITICTPEDWALAGKVILRTGCRYVLVKGGHAEGVQAVDRLYTMRGERLACRTFALPFLDTRNTHGTGCTLSAALAACLAMGMSVEKAVETAKSYITMAISSGKDVKIGCGHGPVNHLHQPIAMRILP